MVKTLIVSMRCRTSGFGAISTTLASTTKRNTCSGPERVKAFLFADNTVQAFIEHYGLEFLPADQQRENVTLRAPAIHILRTLNRVDLKQPERRQIVALVQKIDRILGERGETFRPNEQARTLVAQYARRSWEVLQRKAIRPS